MRANSGIPAELGNLACLTSLNIDNNTILGGAIPPELSNLPNNHQLFLTNNSLTGTIPTEIGDSRELVVLRFADNKLSGEIPIGLGLTGPGSINIFTGGFSGNGCFTADSSIVAVLNEKDPNWQPGCK